MILQTVTEGNLTSSRLALGESIVTSTLLLMKSSVMMIMENTAVAETEDFSRPDIRSQITYGHSNEKTPGQLQLPVSSIDYEVPAMQRRGH